MKRDGHNLPSRLDYSSAAMKVEDHSNDFTLNMASSRFSDDILLLPRAYFDDTTIETKSSPTTFLGPALQVFREFDHQIVPASPFRTLDTGEYSKVPLHTFQLGAHEDLSVQSNASVLRDPRSPLLLPSVNIKDEDFEFHPGNPADSFLISSGRGSRTHPDDDTALGNLDSTLLKNSEQDTPWDYLLHVLDTCPPAPDFEVHSNTTSLDSAPSGTFLGIIDGHTTHPQTAAVPSLPVLSCVTNSVHSWRPRIRQNNANKAPPSDSLAAKLLAFDASSACDTVVSDAYKGVSEETVIQKVCYFRRNNPGVKLPDSLLLQFAGRLNTSGSPSDRFRCFLSPCTKTTKRKDHMADHIRTHLGEKPHQCKVW